MKKPDLPLGKRWKAVFSLTALLVVAADQFSKIWIRSYSEGFVVFEAGFFRVIHVHNTGAAFGLFQDQSFALTIIALVGVVAILVYAFLFSRYFPFLNNILGWVTFGLILGGTTGNLIDRLNPNLSGVTDFIGIGIWPVFNIADSGITVGVILLAYSLLSLSRAKNTDLSD
ncbi:signal peptidase II [Chloroflexota bacterium]